MTALRQLQENLQAYLLNHNPQIAAEITPPAIGTVNDRLAIYGEGYVLRLLEVLGVIYTNLAKLLGADAFEEMGRTYIASHPSRFYSVDLFTQYLSAFLANTMPYQQQPYLSEFARLTWALSTTLDAADAPILEVADVAAIPQDNWPDMCISLHPSVRTETFTWNITDIWQALVDEQTPPPPSRCPEPLHVAVWRKETQAYYVVMNPEDHWALQALQQGQSFGELCEGLLQWLPEEDIAQHAVDILLRWLNDKMLSEIKFPDTLSS